MAHYMDTSALAKLIVAEPETPELQAWLARESRQPVTSDLTRTELMQAVRRSNPDRATLAREVLNSVTLLQLTPTLFDAAGRLEPADLRSLDALHLASALDLGDDLHAIVTYDARLADAANRAGVAVIKPGS